MAWSTSTHCALPNPDRCVRSSRLVLEPMLIMVIFACSSQQKGGKGLAYLTGVYTKRRLLKSSNVTCSNWGTSYLRPNQLACASAITPAFRLVFDSDSFRLDRRRQRRPVVLPYRLGSRRRGSNDQVQRSSRLGLVAPRRPTRSTSQPPLGGLGAADPIRSTCAGLLCHQRDSARVRSN